jgi:hypothetical protein
MSEIWNQQEGQTELTERNISQVKQESKKIREHNKCECVGCLAANYSVKKTRQLDIRSPDTWRLATLTD